MLIIIILHWDFCAVVDRLISVLNHRYAAYDCVNKTFGILNPYSDVIVPKLRNKASCLQMKYSADIEMDFVEETVQFKILFVVKALRLVCSTGFTVN